MSSFPRLLQQMRSIVFKTLITSECHKAFLTQPQCKFQEHTSDLSIHTSPLWKCQSLSLSSKF